jgi:hypothetical protein
MHSCECMYEYVTHINIFIWCICNKKKKKKKKIQEGMLHVHWVAFNDLRDNNTKDRFAHLSLWLVFQSCLYWFNAKGFVFMSFCS